MVELILVEHTVAAVVCFLWLLGTTIVVVGIWMFVTLWGWVRE